ncbi:single-stranded-DNA-specific exonuclease RecJ [bacterium D16-51]|nr:single-stranded-DNA-specific exonuclease RecJ [bacterium D16-59]RKI62674.1 single-stranded-DNA-specific exonuclease RecJ [bacterium D16-51]
MKQWVTKRYQADLEKIAQRYQISEILADILVKRGLFDWDAMSRYLFPERDAMYDAGKMEGLKEAAGILGQKIKEGKKIKIIGDYDVDGVMSSYILYHGIRLLGGMAGCRIPHRVHDGYGMRDYMAQEAFEEGYDTILTCDNGISAVPAVEKAKELGLTVIITDHHEVPKEGGREQLPPADVIVNPKQEKCNYPFSGLCGAGIAYKLMSYLFLQYGRTDCEEELLVFAAIATVCDVVPLLDENRIIVKNGLEYLNNKPKNIGIQYLIEALQFGREINSGDLGFRIGPCINAAGRLKDAVKGLELLMETDKKAAAQKAEELVALNEERKEYTAEATKRAVGLIESQGLLKKPVFVLFVEGCHESVAGIVAGRVREKYYRPTLILTESRNGLKGSARSIPGYHMQKELSKCKNLLTEFGGHAMAAGFSLPRENLEALDLALQANCTLTEKELTEKIFFDREVPLADMTEVVVQQLEYMEPFGEGNERPVFAKRGVFVASLALCGKENQIARLQLRDGLRLYRAVDFQCELHLGEGIRSRYGEAVWEQVKAGQCNSCEIDILYQPEINKMFGNVEFRIVDCR